MRRFNMMIGTCLFVAAMACLSLPASAQCELAALRASDGEESDWFGYAVDLSGDTALVGVPWDDDIGYHAGAAFVYRRDGPTWIEQAKLLPSDGAAYDRIGFAVALEGDLAVLGGYVHAGNGPNSGAVWVYRFDGTTWREDRKLLASDGVEGDNFGRAVAVGGDALIVGAPGASVSSPWSGAAYVFRQVGAEWIEQAKLVPSDGQNSDYFGSSVAIDGDVAVIGAPCSQLPRPGAAYVFRYDGSTWVEEAKLTAAVGEPTGVFGGAVALCGDVAVVGAHQHDGGGDRRGEVFVFRYDGSSWLEEAVLRAVGGHDHDKFGCSVDAREDAVLIGARSVDCSGGNAAGAAYVFRFDGASWSQHAQLMAADARPFAYMGSSVALDGDDALCGAYGDEDDTGAAFLFDLAGEDCNDNGICDDRDIFQGLSPDVNGNGIPDECECLADVNGDNTVNVLDVLAILAAWGATGGPEDVNFDGVVNVLDLLAALADWGPCP